VSFMRIGNFGFMRKAVFLTFILNDHEIIKEKILKHCLLNHRRCIRIELYINLFSQPFKTKLHVFKVNIFDRYEKTRDPNDW
jgi:hypothetical protein